MSPSRRTVDAAVNEARDTHAILVHAVRHAMNSHRRLLIGWLQKVGVGFLALALGGYAVSTNAAESRESAKLVAWKIPFEGSGSRPVIVDGVLYVGSADGAVYALNPNTGETKWRFQTGESLPPA